MPEIIGQVAEALVKQTKSGDDYGWYKMVTGEGTKAFSWFGFGGFATEKHLRNGNTYRITYVEETYNDKPSRKISNAVQAESQEFGRQPLASVASSQLDITRASIEAQVAIKAAVEYAGTRKPATEAGEILDMARYFYSWLRRGAAEEIGEVLPKARLEPPDGSGPAEDPLPGLPSASGEGAKPLMTREAFVVACKAKGWSQADVARFLGMPEGETNPKHVWLQRHTDKTLADVYAVCVEESSADRPMGELSGPELTRGGEDSERAVSSTEQSDADEPDNDRPTPKLESVGDLFNAAKATWGKTSPQVCGALGVKSPAEIKDFPAAWSQLEKLWAAQEVLSKG